MHDSRNSQSLNKSMSKMCSKTIISMVGKIEGKEFVEKLVALASKRLPKG